MKQPKIHSVQIIPVQDMVAYYVDTVAGERESWDIIAIRVTVYEDGHTAWYPVNMEHIAIESILDSHNVDIYWDYIEYKGASYGIDPFRYDNPQAQKKVE
jgi:hypothetical protein